MAKDNKSLNKKPKFNPYWIYGVIIAAFLSIQLFSGGFGASSTKKINPSEFFSYLERGDVNRVLIVNRREVEVYLTKEAMELEVHKKSKPTNLLPSVTPPANYTFEFGELELFEAKSILFGT
ncbi:MAG: ATP-dependent metallopeptidase FtsH/Yme1/Tma family protein [Psychroserpens sp.]|nr:ATP-dependent metallopeptidase FtsH/Yme1/Tma family protein [Psychroserpens sp.]